MKYEGCPRPGVVLICVCMLVCLICAVIELELVTSYVKEDIVGL